MYLGGNHRWLLLLRLSVKLHCDDHINNKSASPPGVITLKLIQFTVTIIRSFVRILMTLLWLEVLPSSS